MRLLDLDAAVTQQSFGDLVGVDQSTVSRMQSLGVLPTPLVVGPAVLAYCARLREQAAGRLGETVGGLDLAQERAALSRTQRLLAEEKLALARGENAPIVLLGEVLATASQAVAERFDHLPGQLRKACPDLAPAAIDKVMATIAAARNEWVRATVALVSAKLAENGDDEPARMGPPCVKPNGTESRL